MPADRVARRTARAARISIATRRIPHSITTIEGRSLHDGPMFGHLFDMMAASIASAIAGELTAAAR
jgi:hypothetical protein